MSKIISYKHWMTLKITYIQVTGDISKKGKEIITIIRIIYPYYVITVSLILKALYKNMHKFLTVLLLLEVISIDNRHALGDL